ncbi:41871_t:CDS:2, partial [Gigaspora margarita]
FMQCNDIDTPSRRASHTATLIANDIIVFIGGYELVADTTIRDFDINQENGNIK